MANARQRTATASAAPSPAAAKPPPAPQRSAAADLMANDDDEGLVALDTDALGTITKSEVSMQLEAAHRWPRSIKRFVAEATDLVTLDKATARSCIFSLPARKGSDKPITGKSVRLAEMAASSWGNLHTGARIINTGERDVTAQAVVWDLEKNLRMGFEVKRGIRTSNGQRYGDDMIRVTSMAAISIALRNAIFRVIPGALTTSLYDAAVRTATGVADDTFAQERDEIVTFFVTRWHVPLDRILARLGIGKVDEMTPDLLATLIGLGQAVKAKECTIEEAFPAPGGGAPEGSRPAKSAPLDVLVNAHKPKAAAAPSVAGSGPAPANESKPAPALTWPLVLAALIKAEPQMWTDAGLPLVMTWTAEQMQLAYDWATAFDSEMDDADLPPRPAFTVLEPQRQPGED